jgi:hypothetical protein
MSSFVKHLAKEIINYANDYEARIKNLKLKESFLEELERRGHIETEKAHYEFASKICEECLKNLYTVTVYYYLEEDSDDDEAHHKKLCEGCFRNLRVPRNWVNWDVV